MSSLAPFVLVSWQGVGDFLVCLSGSLLNVFTLHVGGIFEVDIDIPLPPLPKDVTLLGKFPTVQSMAEHAIGCLLVAEYSYFLMQCEHNVWGEVLSLAVKEYTTSNIHIAVSKAVKAAFHEHNGDMHSLCGAIIKIVVENHMSNKFFMEPRGQ
ncbi:hypothetical protein EV401DRAFT_54714 [Pisolithus croceorrhizus]|nr:hypothetical protein EV401DRAFT_54714 [Pisolithus croceorrhizus]